MEGLKFILVVAALSSTNQMSAFAVTHVGTQCPQPMVMQNFDVTRYQGRWFEYQRFPSALEMGTKCVLANYTVVAANEVTVLNTAIQEYSYGMGLCPWYQARTVVGSAEILDANEPAKLGVSFRPNAPPGNYWVLETDYVTYAVVYSCSQMMGYMPLYSEIAWALTRERGVAPPQLDAIHQRLKDKGVDPSYFELTDQKGCPDWPADK